VNYRSDFRQNIKLALPIMGGQLGQVTVNIADNIMVGKLGAESLAAVSVGNAIFVVFVVVGMGISYALPPLVSEADGSGDYSSVKHNIRASLLVNMSYAIIGLALMYLLIPSLSYLDQDPGALQLALPYLKITAWSLIPLMFFQGLRGYADGMSWTMIPMIAIIVGNVLNIILNYVLIYGNLGAPAMGVAGAAMGSMIARVCMVGIIIFLIYKNKTLWSRLDLNMFRAASANVFKILKLGIPTSLQMFFEVSAFSAAALIMGKVGKIEQASHQISVNLASTSFLICTGLGMAATIRVGNQYGKKDKGAMRRAGISAIIQVIIFMAITAALFVGLRYWLPLLYIDDGEVIKITASLLIMAAVFQIPDGVQVTALGALRGLQDVKVPTIITLVAYWLFGIPLSYYTALHTTIGYRGVWLGLIISLSISSALLSWRFSILTRKSERKI